MDLKLKIQYLILALKILVLSTYNKFTHIKYNLKNKVDLCIKKCAKTFVSSTKKREAHRGRLLLEPNFF